MSSEKKKEHERWREAVIRGADGLQELLSEDNLPHLALAVIESRNGPVDHEDLVDILNDLQGSLLTELSVLALLVRHLIYPKRKGGETRWVSNKNVDTKEGPE